MTKSDYRTFRDHAIRRNHVADWDLVIKNGQLIVPEGPGIGLSLDPKKLRKYRLDK